MKPFSAADVWPLAVTLPIVPLDPLVVPERVGVDVIDDDENVDEEEEGSAGAVLVAYPKARLDAALAPPDK